MATASATVPHLGTHEIESRLAQLATKARPKVASEEARKRRDTWKLVGGFAPAPVGGVAAREPWRVWDAQGCKAALAERARLDYRAELLGNEGQGPASRDAAPDLAAQLLRRFALDNPTGPARLATQMDVYVREDAAELAEVRARIEAAQDQYARHGDEPHWDRLARPAVERLLTLERRSPLRREALADFKSVFPKCVGKAIGNRQEALASGLAESLASSGGLPPAPPEIDAAEAELMAVEAELGKLCPVAGVAPGPLAKGLADRKTALEATVESHRAGHADRIKAAIRGPIDGLLKGDVAAWEQVASAIVSRRDAFPEDLADAVLAAPVAAILASDPVAWAECLCGAVARGPGRESSWEAP